MIKADRIQLIYTLKFHTPFHCGTGIRENLIDRTIVRDKDGYLYVPGSTFKGVLRECCEQLARFCTQDKDMKQLIVSPHIREPRELLGQITMVTRIFGSAIHPGQLFFEDIRQTEKVREQYDGRGEDDESKGKYKSMQVDLYTQVRLNRPTHTAVGGALYTSELGVKTIVFEGRIAGWLECTTIDPEIDTCFVNHEDPENSPTYSLLLLLAGIHLVDRVGGNKSTGKGQCRCEITQLRVNGKEYKAEVWRVWLGRLKALSFYYRSQEGNK